MMNSPCGVARWVYSLRQTSVMGLYGFEPLNSTFQSDVYGVRGFQRAEMRGCIHPFSQVDVTFAARGLRLADWLRDRIREYDAGGLCVSGPRSGALG